MNVITIFVEACIFLVLFTIIQSVMLWRFLRQVPMISDEVDLERFKKVARVGMYLAILAMPFILVMVISSIAIVVLHGISGLGTVLLFNLGVVGGAKLGRLLEVRARSLRVEDEELAESYRQVGKVWVEKMFPNF